MKFLKAFVTLLFIVSAGSATSVTQRNIVVYAIDDNCVRDVATSIQSMATHAKSPIDYYIFDAGISPENKAKLERWTSIPNGGRARVRPIPEEIMEQMKKLNGTKWNSCIFFKFFVPDLLSDVDKCLWLDADTIFAGDITPIFSTNMQGAYYTGTNGNLISPETLDELCAQFSSKTDDQFCASLFSTSITSRIGSYNGVYNGGLLLIDCERYRRNKIKDLLIRNCEAFKTAISMRTEGCQKISTLVRNYSGGDCTVSIPATSDFGIDNADDEMILTLTAAFSGKLVFLPYRYNVILKSIFPRICANYGYMKKYNLLDDALQSITRKNLNVCLDLMGCLSFAAGMQQELDNPVMLHFDTAFKPKILGKEFVLSEVNDLFCVNLVKILLHLRKVDESTTSTYLTLPQSDKVKIGGEIGKLSRWAPLDTDRIKKVIESMGTDPRYEKAYKCLMNFAAKNPYVIYFDTLLQTPFVG